MSASIISIDRDIPRRSSDCQTLPGARRRIAAGKEIYAQDDSTTEVYQLVSGAVRTTHLTGDGRRQVGAFHYPGDIFGLEYADARRFSAEALTDCEIVVAARSSLQGLDDSVATLNGPVWTATLRQLEYAQDHLMLLGRKTACEKVAAFLVDLAGRLGGETAELPMSRQDIADYLGLTIETVSRMVSHLQAKGFVEFLGSRRFRLRNHEGLRRLAAA